MEWPVFAAFVIFVWWREVRSATSAGPPPRRRRRSPDPGEVRRPVVAARRGPAYEDTDPEVTAYNHYLAWLNANPGARPADYPGPPVAG